MKKSIWITCLSLILLTTILSGPYLTVADIKTAIIEKDSEKLSENTDFFMLRQNIKEQLNMLFSKITAKDIKSNPLSALSTTFSAVFSDKMVDMYVTPEGIINLIEGKKPSLRSKANTAETDKKRIEDIFSKSTYSLDSTSTFSVWFPTEDGTEVRFVLRRFGLSWKLVNIILPVEGLMQ